jgi:ABC-2 type transport system permease protein
MKAMWSLAWLDLVLWSRSPMAIACALIPPICMTALLIVLSMAVTQQPVALVIAGSGANAEKMAKLIEADDDAYLLRTVDESTAARLLRDQEVAAVITIPEDFDKRLDDGELATVVLTLNNVDIDFADDIRRSVDRTVATFDAPQLSKEGEQSDKAAQNKASGNDSSTESENPYLINVEEHDLRETNVEWLSFQVIPAIILLILNVGLMGTALLCAQDIERKTARQLLLSPQESWLLVAGRMLGGLLACVVVLVPVIGAGLATRVINPPADHWPALLAVFFTTSLAASGLGATLGTVLKGARTISLASCVISTYLFLLGGGFTNIAFLPDWLRALSSLVPTRYAIDGMRQALFYQSLAGISTELTILCGISFICCLVGALRVHQSWS